MAENKPAVKTKLQPKPNNNFKKFLLTVIAGGLLLGGVIIYWHYFYIYNKGYDKGVLVKFVQRGDVIPTYEGEINRRQAEAGYSDADTILFSVTDTFVASALKKAIGKKVRVHYNQYYGPLPWRGDNYNGQNEVDGQIIVDSLLKTGDANDRGF
jgi:hypothetical protein